MALSFVVERESEAVKPPSVRQHVVVWGKFTFEIVIYLVLVMVTIVGGLVQTLWWLFPGLIFSLLLLMTIIEQTAKDTIKNLFRGWGVVARNHGVLMVSFVQACQYYAYGAVEFFLAGYLPEVVHLNEFLTGIIITSIIGVAIFARPYMGRVSDKYGRRVPIAVGCIVSALPLLAIPFVADFWILLLLVVIYGFGLATVTASTSALTSELVPKELIGTSMGFLDMLMDVGQTLGPIISGFILATNLQYRGVFPSLAIVLLLSCIIFVLSGAAKVGRHRRPVP
jgi:MFS family permease